MLLVSDCRQTQMAGADGVRRLERHGKQIGDLRHPRLIGSPFVPGKPNFPSSVRSREKATVKYQQVYF
jgi:hypothetical protein